MARASILQRLTIYLAAAILLASGVLGQYKSTQNSQFERPNFANSNMTKPAGPAPGRQKTTIGLEPSATYKIFSHENYTLPERDSQAEVAMLAKAEDLNLENYYTEFKFEVTFIMANQTRGANYVCWLLFLHLRGTFGYFVTTKDYYLNRIDIEVEGPNGVSILSIKNENGYVIQFSFQELGSYIVRMFNNDSREKLVTLNANCYRCHSAATKSFMEGLTQRKDIEEKLGHVRNVQNKLAVVLFDGQRLMEHSVRTKQRVFEWAGLTQTLEGRLSRSLLLETGLLCVFGVLQVYWVKRLLLKRHVYAGI